MTQGRTPGALMRTEMGEQPGVLDQLIRRRAETIRRVKSVAPDPLAGIVLLARGSSDNAALHARYLLELATGRPVALAAPSLWTRYRSNTELRGWVAVAISQSGRTPEIVTVMERMATHGARTVAVTNGCDSALAAAAQVAVTLQAGDELAVPATKTITASLLALVHVAAALGTLPWAASDEGRAVEGMATVLDDEAAAARSVSEVKGRELVHLGRGFTLPVALEAALKMKETTTAASRGYSSGDLLHGPIASVGPDSAIVAYAAQGPTFEDVTEAAEHARAQGASTLLVSDSAPGGDDMGFLGVPSGLPEPLVALPMLVRAQQLALHATLAAGLDPDTPPGLSKVTITH